MNRPVEERGSLRKEEAVWRAMNRPEEEKEVRRAKNRPEEEGRGSLESYEQA